MPGFLVNGAARQLRDMELQNVESWSWDELTAHFGSSDHRRVVESDGRRFEVLGTGGFDTDESSDFFVWLYVRPVGVARIPVLRWLMSARAVHYRDNPAYPPLPE